MVEIPEAAAYAASKAAVRNHTKKVALYCCEKGYGIRCNSIHPAAILTPMWELILGSGIEREGRLAIAKDIRMRKLGTPEDIAYAALSWLPMKQNILLWEVFLLEYALDWVKTA